jgi:hypothetical protein
MLTKEQYSTIKALKKQKFEIKFYYIAILGEIYIYIIAFWINSIKTNQI